MFFQARSGVNWEAVVMHGGISNGTTPNGIDTGQAQATGYRNFGIIYDEATQQCHFYYGGGYLLSVASPLPVGDGFQVGATIQKSVGTTTRSLYLDIVDYVGIDYRGPQGWIP
jgi:hypothetical protein